MSLEKYNLTEQDLFDYATENELFVLKEGSYSGLLQLISRDQNIKNKFMQLLKIDDKTFGQMTYLNDTGFRTKYKEFLAKRGLQTFEDFKVYIERLIPELTKIVK